MDIVLTIILSILTLTLLGMFILGVVGYKRLFGDALKSYEPVDFGDDEEEQEEGEEFVTRQLRINQEDPPRVMIYNPVSEDEAFYCRCHNNKLEGGQEIVWWPNPDTGGVDLICAENVSIEGEK